MGVPTCPEKNIDKTLQLRDGTFLGTQKGRQGVTKDVCCFKRKKTMGMILVADSFKSTRFCSLFRLWLHIWDKFSP